jgi:Flp pilus assembly secretin CpaC
MHGLAKVSAVLASIGLIAIASSAQAQAVSLEVDQSRPLHFSSPVTGVVVGNAGVADVIVHDSKTLFVIGKSVGTTHVLAVDQRGRTVYSGQVAVRAAALENVVTVQRGREISTSICNERCIAVPTSEATQNSMADAIARARARSAFAGGSN